MSANRSLLNGFLKARTLSALAVAATIVCSTGCSVSHPAVGQDNGTLQSTYMATSFRTAPEVHRAEASTLVSSAPLNHHDYALSAR